MRPWRPPPCPPHGDGAYPLALAGAPQRSGAAPAGDDRGSTRARHGGARRLFDLARPPTRASPPPCLWAARTATRLEGGIVTVRHMAPTLGEPDSPEICPTTTYFKLFR